MISAFGIKEDLLKRIALISVRILPFSGNTPPLIVA
jgi:hypothetical protein